MSTAKKTVDFEEMAAEIDREGLAPDKLDQLVEYVDELKRCGAKLTDLLLQVKAVGDRQRELSEVLIPNLLEGTGLSELRLADRTKVVVGEALHASTGANSKYLGAILKWLQDTGHDDIIKDEVSVPFGKGESERVSKLAEMLVRAGYHFARDRTVNNQTFTALLRELMSDGEVVPLSELGVFIRKFTKLEVPK